MAKKSKRPKKPTRLVTLARVDLPVPEASGAASCQRGGQPYVLVVGDRTHQVASAAVVDGRFGEWRVHEVTDVAGWPSSVRTSSQFEAVTADGGSLVALMREDPPEVLVVDLDTRRLVSRIQLVVPPWSALAGKWDDPASRGEGLVLLRDGRLLVAKERKPRALVEFGPVGSVPHGLSHESFLESDESWAAPEGDVRYHSLAVWKLRDEAKQAVGDISALAVGPDRSLWMLSDKSEVLVRRGMDFPLPPGGGEIRSLDDIYRLPKDVVKPEGVVALGNQTVLVTLDTPEARSNGLVLGPPGTPVPTAATPDPGSADA